MFVFHKQRAKETEEKPAAEAPRGKELHLESTNISQHFKILLSSSASIESSHLHKKN